MQNKRKLIKYKSSTCGVTFHHINTAFVHHLHCDIICVSSTGEAADGRSTITDAEIKAVSETLYSLDSNKASASQLITDTQALVSNSQTNSQADLSSQP